MVQEPYKNADDMPISDILTEIRMMVSNETNMRYSRDRDLAVSELLVLRPEARVDLAITDAVVEPVKKPKPKPVSQTLDHPLGFKSRDELRDFIRQVFVEEFEKWSES